MRRVPILATTIAALSMVLPSATPDNVRLKPGELWLEFPDLHIKVEPNSSAMLPQESARRMELHISNAAGQIGYGTIHTKINTEAANIVMTLTGTSDGMLGSFDLEKHAGFTFTPGRNSVEVEYKDAYERVHYASFLLQVGGAGAVPRQLSGPPASVKGELYAVVIGISKYQNSGAGITDLKYARRDAEDFLDFVKSPAGGNIPKDHIYAAFDQDATGENVRYALFTFITRARPQDMVLLYLAGHGAPDPNDSRTPYFLTYDTQIDNMGGTALRMRELQEAFANSIKTKRVIAFNDTCHSYGFSGQRYGVVSQNLANQYVAKSISQSGGVVISSSDISELAAEDEKWGGGHGVFTYFLLKGLAGAADKNKDGTVTVGEIFDYVQKNVQEATGEKQNPRASNLEASANLPISGFAMRPAVAKLRRGTDSIGAAELSNSNGGFSRCNASAIVREVFRPTFQP